VKLDTTGSRHDILTVLQAGQVMNFISIRDKKLFSSVKCPEWLWGVHSFLSSGYVGKATDCEPDHSCPCDVKVKNVVTPPTSHVPSWCCMKLEVVLLLLGRPSHTVIEIVVCVLDA
jgi:hypothetical protein